MPTLLERRQTKTLTDLQKRKQKAQDYISLHTANLNEKLAAYHNELAVVEKLIEDHNAQYPKLDLQQAS